MTATSHRAVTCDDLHELSDTLASEAQELRVVQRNPAHAEFKERLSHELLVLANAIHPGMHTSGAASMALGRLGVEIKAQQQ